jgi:hypothetical protein
MRKDYFPYFGRTLSSTMLWLERRWIRVGAVGLVVMIVWATLWVACVIEIGDYEDRYSAVMGDYLSVETTSAFEKIAFAIYGGLNLIWPVGVLLFGISIVGSFSSAISRRRRGRSAAERRLLPEGLTADAYKAQWGAQISSTPGSDYRQLCAAFIEEALLHPRMYFHDLGSLEQILQGHAVAFSQLELVGRRDEMFNAAFADWLRRETGVSAAAGWAQAIADLAAVAGMDAEALFVERVWIFLVEWVGGRS